IAGVYRQSAGEVTIGGQSVYENTALKQRIAFIPDELYFLPGANLMRMIQHYAAIYNSFDVNEAVRLANVLDLPRFKSISQFSKGMKRQSATILAIASNPDILLFDETFDGLDPIARGAVKRLLTESIVSKKATAIITSHSLRELEDTCDALAFLHRGGLVMQSDISNLKTSLLKVQVALPETFSRETIADTGISILSYSQVGRVANIIATDEREAIEAALSKLDPIILETLPLSLEEVFTYEMKQRGYNFDDILGEIADANDAAGKEAI
ncbi:MAG: ATP-binding cassette domain-containing protein, partial [Oscillospiraceae bacterium]|nr:ATP-binding cassette domain-containing protein [Oscillospiraceae bacterium]